MTICVKCKREYRTSTCPKCKPLEQQQKLQSDVAFDSIAFMIAESLADTTNSVTSAAHDSYDGGGGDFGGGGSSGDW
jgi:uncharacterized membrane protein YgcG